MKTLLFFLLFFVVSALLIISNNNLSLIDGEELNEFEGLYFEWFGGLFSNLGVVTGEIIRLDWIPQKVVE